MRLIGQVPNAITLTRLSCAPVVFALVISERDSLAFWVFLVAGLSDAADGIVARLTRTQSLLGSYLDAIADKVLLDGVYISFAIVGSLDVRLVTLVVFRDTLLVGGSSLVWLRGARKPLHPLPESKVNTVAQIALASEILAHRGLGWFPSWLTPGLAVTVAATTLISGCAYAVAWFRDENRGQGREN